MAKEKPNRKSATPPQEHVFVPCEMTFTKGATQLTAVDLTGDGIVLRIENYGQEPTAIHLSAGEQRMLYLWLGQTVGMAVAFPEFEEKELQLLKTLKSPKNKTHKFLRGEKPILTWLYRKIEDAMRVKKYAEV